MRNKDVDAKAVAGTGDKSAISRLRLLDFDDLFLLSHLLEGSTIAATAKQLGLTQPAITQRVRKIERVFADNILQKVGRHVRLTKEGRAICVKAADALALMRDVTSEGSEAVVTIGASATTGSSRLWPALLELREMLPEYLFHAYIGSTEEVVQLLDAGSLDGCLTSEPYAGGLHGVLDVGEEEFVFVARRDVAATVTSVAQLEQLTLLEIDRSYPLLSRVEATARATLRFKGVWFVGTVNNVLAAATAGQGVAILPQALVRAGLAADRLGVILPELDLTPEHFRLIFRQDRGREVMLRHLGERLSKSRG